MSKKDTQKQEKTSVNQEKDKKIEQLTEHLANAESKYQRALADYQNLVRRNREESSRRAKLASKEFVSELLQPLNHLALAANQINDPGLNMVVSQLWEVLNAQGLQEVDCLGKPFDAETMEVVEITDKGVTVEKVLTPCYQLHGEVLQFAKVVLD